MPTIALTASANDTEDGDLTSGIAWSSDVDGVLGSGGNINVNLTEATYVVTASITDSQSAESNSAVIVTVAFRIGDINLDWVVDLQDLVIMEGHLNGTDIIADGDTLQLADLYPAGSGDGEIDVSDLLLLQQLLPNQIGP